MKNLEKFSTQLKQKAKFGLIESDAARHNAGMHSCLFFSSCVSEAQPDGLVDGMSFIVQEY